MTDNVPTPHPKDQLRQAVRDALNPTVSGLGELRQTLAAELDLDIEDVRVHGYIPGRETRHGYDARLRIEVLNGTAARPVPQGTEHATRDMDAEDYRALADHVIELTNPPDDDVAEVSIVMDAVTRLHMLAVSLPCACPAPEMGDDLCATDACGRCRALGRIADKDVER